MGRLDADTFRLEDLSGPPAFIPETVSAGRGVEADAINESAFCVRGK